MGWKGIDFRFLSGRKWVARLRFYTTFTPTFYRLITVVAIMMDSRPARFLFPVALLPVPAWWQHWQSSCFQSEYPRGQLPWTDSPATASGGSYPWIWNGQSPFPLPVGPRGRRRAPTRQSTCYSGCNKTQFFNGESADFNSKYTKLHWELEFTPNLYYWPIYAN